MIHIKLLLLANVSTIQNILQEGYHQLCTGQGFTVENDKKNSF